MSTAESSSKGLRRFLPAMGSPLYHVMLSLVAILILGPLGGISATFMNFSIGFFIGGQVLAGILGSTVTLPYGPEGKHGANYMQTMAASVADMCAMGVLIQAMIWLGIPEPAGWKLVLYFLCIGMYGAGVGMLYTPIVVDRMQLMFPSGYAVANILRALTDPVLLKRSIAKLGGGLVAGLAGGVFSLVSPVFTLLGASIDPSLLSTSTLGAGMVVGVRIAAPALLVAFIGEWTRPYLVSIHWLEEGEPFRKIGFIIALGTILGAAILDLVIILYQALQQLRAKRVRVQEESPDWKKGNSRRLIAWVVFWGLAVVVVGSAVLQQPVLYLVIAVLLALVFVLINGISMGISDSNPLSSAFVLTVFILAALGLKDPGVGLMCASILYVACNVGGDMQQDRSTGWRLGTNRVVQFRYQVIGIIGGTFLSVALAKVFLNAYPVLKVDQFAQHVEGAQQWQSAMTYKFVGALRGITNPNPHVMRALWLGIWLGLGIEAVRKLVKRSVAYQRFVGRSLFGYVTDFVLDCTLIASPYASSFGGFVDLSTMVWWTGGGALSSFYDSLQERKARRHRTAGSETQVLPSDMGTMSLIGGGLIAGDSLAALGVGLWGLFHTLF